MGAIPPPPPATLHHARVERLLPVWAAAQCAVGLALVAWPTLSETAHAPVYTLVGVFLVVHASLLLSTAFAESPLARRALKTVGKHVINSGVGFYGLVTFSRFLHLEALDFVDGLQSGLPTTARELIKDWVMGFSIDSLMNTIEAFQWPWKLLLNAGWPVAAMALAACYLPYTMANRFLPDVAKLVSAKDAEDAKDSDKSDVGSAD